MRLPTRLLSLFLLTPASLLAQDFVQTQADDFTRYELQAPGSGAFRIVYDVTVTTPGAPYYFNTIRAGAEEVVHGVTDLHTGEALEWQVVDGPRARADGHLRASDDGHYIRVTLARPVPEGGETRIRIDKTYVDRDSYFTEGAAEAGEAGEAGDSGDAEGDEVVFDRSLGIRRNAVVLPPGYELVSVNHPSQVGREPGGRIRVSFMNGGAGAVGYVVRGRRLGPGDAAALRERSRLRPVHPGLRAGRVPDGSEDVRSQASVPAAARDRELVYDLGDPAESAFRLRYDVTLRTPGSGRWLRTIRRGTEVTEVRARLLDTGEEVPAEILRGEAIVEAGFMSRSAVSEETALLRVTFAPAPENGSSRLRVEEDLVISPDDYRREGAELFWTRTLGTPRTSVALPTGWMLTGSTAPARVSLDPEGRVRLELWNAGSNALVVDVTALERTGG